MSEYTTNKSTTNKSIANKWNARYASSSSEFAPASMVLAEGLRWLPDSQASSQPNKQPVNRLKALDLACGRAGNAQLLAQRDFCVSAWDISDSVIEQIKQRRPAIIDYAVVRDVSQQPPEPDSFDVIVVSRFLDRSICPAIAKALKPSGILFYQTFVHGLSNPDYLLASNELLTLFSDLHTLEYHEPDKDEHGKAEARLVARRSI